MYSLSLSYIPNNWSWVTERVKKINQPENSYYEQHKSSNAR